MSELEMIGILMAVILTGCSVIEALARMKGRKA